MIPLALVCLSQAISILNLFCSTLYNQCDRALRSLRNLEDFLKIHLHFVCAVMLNCSLFEPLYDI